MRYLILCFLLVACGKEAAESISYQTSVPTSEPKEYFVSEVFNIAKSQLTLNKDEFGFIDIPTSYLYFRNLDSSYAKILISGANFPIINEKIYRRVDLTVASLPTNVTNLQKDDGTALDAVNHTLINYLYFNNDKLCVNLQLLSVTGIRVVNRTVCED